MPARAKHVPDWSAIRCVFLDMDGTLLDLHFDNHFWLEHVPLRFAERRGLSLEAAKSELMPRFRQMQGTLQWYCVDYWSRELDLDVLALKREVQHLIQVQPGAEEFLRQTRAAGKRLVLLTNAHPDVLAFKLRRTGLERHFDHVISSHTLGSPKETPEFWGSLHTREGFNGATTLFVDDSLPVLRAARENGVCHLIAVRKPDSQRPALEIEEFPSVETLMELMP